MKLPTPRRWLVRATTLLLPVLLAMAAAAGPGAGAANVTQAVPTVIAATAVATPDISRRASLTLAVSDNPYAAPALLAEAQGYFADEGLKLKVIHCSIGRICLQHLLDGKAHFATVADVPIVMASFQRRDLGIVTTLTTSGREYRIVVRPERGIRRAEDLRGKRIGTIMGSSGQYFTESYLLYHGIDRADVTLVPLDPQDPSSALVRGEVDAAGLFEPHVRDAQRRLGPRVALLPASGFFTNTFNLVSVSAASGASDDDIVRLLRALQRAVNMMRNEPFAARTIVARALHMDVGALARSWDDFDFKLDLGQPLITHLEAQGRWALREHLVPADTPLPDYLNMIRSAPLRRLDPRAVRLVQ